MKGKTILGVALTLMLLGSLLFSAAPVSAGTLSWSDVTIPSADDEVIVSCNITDLTVGEDGETIFAAVSDNVIYRSTDRGVTWSEITVIDTIDDVLVTLEPEVLAVAPDDSYFVAAANVSAPCGVYITDDAGATWDTLGAPTGLDTINDIAVSVESGGNRWIAVAGEDTDTSNGQVWYYEIGAVGAAWTEMSDNDTDIGSGFTTANWSGAVEFSPNFASDEVLVAVTANLTHIHFQIFSFNQEEWNGHAGTFTDYPVKIVSETTDADVDKLDSASIALSPDYLGSDDSMRLAFVGITTDGSATADEADGIFRLDDDDVDTVKDDKNIHSVAYDGTNLVAGEYDDVTVYRCDDPLASSPSVSGSASLKSPGGVDLTVVAWAGDDVVAGTTGDESAFAVSRNNGKSFNDISLIDTALTNLRDVAVSADGSNVYLVTDEGANLSLWRYASAWERVLTVQATSNYIVRTAPDDVDVVYVAEMDGSIIYYSADAGEARWHTRTSRYELSELAVETDGEVVYAVTGSGYVSKSTNSGFTWASKKSSKLSAGISMLTSLDKDVLLAGSTDGYVSYSTDGGTTWTKLDDQMEAEKVQVIGSGVTTDDFVYASTWEAGDDIYSWDWADEEWDAIYEDVGTSDNVTGIALQDGVLYVVSCNKTGSTSYRTLNPTSSDPTWSVMYSVGELFDATPSALRVSGGSNKMWAVSTNTSDLFSYTDTIVDVGPSLVSPKHGFADKINPVTGRAMDVTFVWEKPSSKVEGYQLRIALDEGFDEVLRTIDVASDDDVVSQIAGPHGSETAEADLEFMPETTYYWKVRVNDPIYSPWSIVYTLSVEEALAPFPEVTVEAPPAPEVTVTAPPAPEVTVNVPPAPAPVTPAPAIPAYLLWTIIIIGAVLMIALIVLIVRTRRVV